MVADLLHNLDGLLEHWLSRVVGTDCSLHVGKTNQRASDAALIADHPINVKGLQIETPCRRIITLEIGDSACAPEGLRTGLCERIRPLKP